jgi:hypothetical protein
MDIVEAARYGWNKKATISLFLRNLTPDEFAGHSWLDAFLAEQPSTMIYYMNKGERITRRRPINGDIGVHHGHGELSDGYVSLDTSPEFKEQKGYEDFVFKMAEHLGGKKKNVFLMPTGVWDCIVGNIWKGAKAVGHKEIADLASYFDEEFVKKQMPGARTRISAAYEKLTPREILRMGYNPKNVVSFKIK